MEISVVAAFPQEQADLFFSTVRGLLVSLGKPSLLFSRRDFRSSRCFAEAVEAASGSILVLASCEKEDLASFLQIPVVVDLSKKKSLGEAVQAFLEDYFEGLS